MPGGKDIRERSMSESTGLFYSTFMIYQAYRHIFVTSVLLTTFVLSSLLTVFFLPPDRAPFSGAEGGWSRSGGRV